MQRFVLFRISTVAHLAAVLLPLGLAAQQGSQDPDDLKPANGWISDSLGTFRTIRELADGRVLVPNGSGGVSIADFAAGRAKTVSGMEAGYRNVQLFALPGDSTLIYSVEGWLIADGVKRVGMLPAKSSLPSAAPSLLGADADGFVLAIVGGRPDDSASIVRVARATGARDLLTRVRLWPLGSSFADLREQAILAPDGWIAVFRAMPYRVDWRTAVGEWRHGEPLVLPSLAMDDREKAAVRKQDAAFTRPGTDNRSWADSVQLYGGPNLLYATPDSCVVILRRPIADAMGSLYDVIDRRGKLIREFTLPGNEKVVGFGRSSVYVRVAHGTVTGFLERHPWP